LVSDGAAALVLTSTERALATREKVVEIAGFGHSAERSALAERLRKHELEGAKDAKRKAFAEAGIGIGAVDLAEVHDCFTVNQLLCTEALGLSADSRAGYD